MKVNLFQQAPYRFMPAGFEDSGVPSVVKPPYAELVEPGKMFDSYQWFIDELLAGVRAGFDGVAVTEHGQTSYDMTPNPNLPAAVLAHAIRSERRETALIVLGRSLGKTTEPLRIAEEYAMLDVMSGGRLVAGLPVGLSYDANLNNGIPTVETRDRYREAVELMFRSWTDEAPFTWNGRFSQYSLVNSWPRPLQRPRPPVWVPGSGSPSTMQWTIDQDYAFVYLGWFGPTLTAHRIFDRFWGLGRRERHSQESVSCRFRSERRGVRDRRAGRGGVRAVCRDRVPSRCRERPRPLPGPPGLRRPAGVETLLRDPGDLGLAAELQHATFGRLAEARSVIAGSPATVREQIVEFVKEFRIGNLLVMLQMGGMPHDLTMKNIHLFAEEVMPHVKSGVGRRRLGEQVVADRSSRAGRRSEMTAPLEIAERVVPVWGSRLDMTVQVAGEGPPLVYLHAAGGMMWDPFLEQLAGAHTVYAPLVPGTAPGKPHDISKVDDLWDLVLIYDETIRALGVEGAPVVGQSFGGMLALELAAHFPALFSRVVVLDPIGLWLDDHPVANWVAVAPDELPGLLFHQPDGDAARAMFTPPDDPEAAIAAIVAMSWATGCTSKFVWPVPDKGLVKRLHRIQAPRSSSGASRTR